MYITRNLCRPADRAFLPRPSPGTALSPIPSVPLSRRRFALGCPPYSFPATCPLSLSLVECARAGRTSKQCRERWCHHLNPDINKGPYTEQEDETILKVHEKLGNKWSLIAAKLPGRTENSIKIRCKALQRKNGGARGGGKFTATATAKSPRPAKKSARISTAAPSPTSCSPVSSASSSRCLSPGAGGDDMVDDDQPPLSGRPVAPGLAPLPPQRRPGTSSSRGLKFDPLFMCAGETLLLPAAAPGDGAALPSTGNRYGRFGVKAEPLEWPPSGELRVGEMFPISNHHQQQQLQQSRYQPLPSLGHHLPYGGRPVRSGFFIGGGGGGLNSDGGDGMFDDRLTPTGGYLGQPRQVPLGHFSPDFNPPLPQTSASAARGQGQQEEVYPVQRQACLIDDDDELEAEALAAVEADGIPSAGTAAGNMTSLAGNIASLEEISATIRAAAAGQDVGGGHPGDDLKEAGVGDRDEDRDEEGNGPLRSCCSFLALNAQDDIVGDSDSWQEEKDNHDDGGGALMME